MKTIFNLLALELLFLITACETSRETNSYRVMTLNIRYDNPGDSINCWQNRKEYLVASLEETSPDIIGMQEVLESQRVYLDENLPGYSHAGVGRNDGKAGGEYAPVFFRKDIFTLVDWGTFWLPLNPGVTGSIGWDAALPRICTWVRLLDQQNKTEFYFLNTHFDHMGVMARKESAALIVDFIRNETGGFPVILTGDFNCSPEDEPYRLMTDGSSGLKDACPDAASASICGEGTFNGFGFETDPERIDMIFTKGGFQPELYELLKLKKENMFISDHWPVVVELFPLSRE